MMGGTAAKQTGYPSTQRRQTDMGQMTSGRSNMVCILIPGRVGGTFEKQAPAVPRATVRRGVIVSRATGSAGERARPAVPRAMVRRGSADPSDPST